MQHLEGALASEENRESVCVFVWESVCAREERECVCERESYPFDRNDIVAAISNLRKVFNNNGGKELHQNLLRDIHIIEPTRLNIIRGSQILYCSIIMAVKAASKPVSKMYMYVYMYIYIYMYIYAYIYVEEKTSVRCFRTMYCT